MSDELLPWYNRELAFLRKTAAGFAEENPKIAGRLRLGPDGSDDPHVERLIEAFAYLNARTRHKLEDDFPELTEALLGVLYPHYLAPVPSMTVVQFQFDESQAALVGGYTVSRDTEIETEPIDGEPVRFRTGYDVTLWPVRVASARLAGRPLPAPQVGRSTEAVAVLHIRLACLSDEVTIGQLSARSHRFFLKGPPQYVSPLYELLCNNALQVVLAGSADDRRPLLLGPDAIQPVGFERDEGLLPYAARSPLAYRLLSEYFAFPQKFLFFDVNGIEPRRLSRLKSQLELFIYLDRSTVDLERNVSSDTIALGCTPAVNLFRQRAEPFQLTETEHEYRLVPDARRPMALEVYSVDAVAATGPDGDEIEYLPFFSVRHAEETTPGHAWWFASRRASETPKGEVDHGTEVYLSLVDLAGRPSPSAGWYLDVETTCLNRDLPARLPFGGEEPRLYLSQKEGPVARVVCLTPPTPTRRPPRRDRALWRLISHLSLGHLSLADGASGATALREILKLYDVADSPETRDIIESITSVSHRRVAGRVPGDRMGGVCRGLEVEIEFRSESSSEKGLFLFAGVLERFLGLYCSINSFSKLTARLRGRERVLRRWPPRAGEKVLL